MSRVLIFIMLILLLVSACVLSRAAAEEYAFCVAINEQPGIDAEYTLFGCKITGDPMEVIFLEIQ